jgi:hypothetical protein
VCARSLAVRTFPIIAGVLALAACTRPAAPPSAPPPTTTVHLAVSGIGFELARTADTCLGWANEAKLDVPKCTADAITQDRAQRLAESGVIVQLVRMDAPRTIVVLSLLRDEQVLPPLDDLASQ